MRAPEKVAGEPYEETCAKVAAEALKPPPQFADVADNFRIEVYFQAKARAKAFAEVPTEVAENHSFLALLRLAGKLFAEDAAKALNETESSRPRRRPRRDVSECDDEPIE